MSISALSGLVRLYRRDREYNEAKKRVNSAQINPVIQNTKIAPLEKDTFEHKGHTGWVEIPSKNHDNNNFSQNYQLLKLFWDKSWRFNPAPGHMINSDYHIYLDNGKPVLAIEYYNDPDLDNQSEILYTSLENEISDKYSDIIDKHLDEVSKR